MKTKSLLPYPKSLAGTLLAARESVMAPIRPMLREANLTEQQWRVLRILDGEGTLEPAPLARLALLHPPSLTRILRELLDRELISRTWDKVDPRRSVIGITPQGEEVVAHTAAFTMKILDEYGARFGTERLAALRNELAALVVAIEGCAEGVGADEDRAISA